MSCPRGAWRYRYRYPDQLFWWIRLGAWLVVSAPLVVVRPWLTAVGPFVFELGWFTFERWRAASLRRRFGGPPPSPWDDPHSGDREPRRPPPLAGSGAVALPIPVEGVG